MGQELSKLINNIDFLMYTLTSKLSELKSSQSDWKRTELRQDIKVIRDAIKQLNKMTKAA